MNSLIFFEIEGKPDAVQLRGLLDLYELIFGTDKIDKVLHRLASKEQIHIGIAACEGAYVGFKIGYKEDDTTFYSWLGGVHDSYRNQGIASKLMELQHAWCIKKGFNAIKTKTMNRWRNMLILNIKHGFDIINTYQDADGAVKIVLEKKLK